MVIMVTVVHKVVVLPNGRTPFDSFALGTLRLYDSDVGFAVSKNALALLPIVAPFGPFVIGGFFFIIIIYLLTHKRVKKNLNQ